MLSVVVGTRPEIVKMAPIILELRRRRWAFQLLHTGQHYDRELSEVFLEELGLPEPDQFLDVGSGSPAQQTAEAMIRLETTLLEDGGGPVLVEGDTNTVLAGALAAAKLGRPVGHVEAGLRSYDLRMPEEHNRRVVDHLSTYLYAPTTLAAQTLRREEVWGRIRVVGNTVIDAILRYLPVARRKSPILDQVRFDRFALATLHRAENVDDRSVLGELVKILTDAPLPVVLPLHPRTMARLKAAGWLATVRGSPNVQLLPPVGYFDFLVLMKKAALILTDSGGIQEEATAPGIEKDVFVLRKSTERPEAVTAGYARVVGTQSRRVLAALRRHLKGPAPRHRRCPFGDGHAGKRIVDDLATVAR